VIAEASCAFAATLTCSVGELIHKPSLVPARESYVLWGSLKPHVSAHLVDAQDDRLKKSAGAYPCQMRRIIGDELDNLRLSS
jgi:hypothetical protein